MTALIAACAARGEGGGEQAASAIGAMLDDWHDAAARADEERYFGHLTADAVFLGTDASERWSTEAFRAYAHPHFAKGRAWAFRAVRRDVVVRGDVAWFDEDLATANLGPARGSGVVLRRGGRWRIAHYNLALTIPNDRFALVKEAAAAEVMAPSEEGLAAIAWLAGAWVSRREDGAVVEELWTSPRGGSMIGSGRTSKDGATEFFEHLRIELRDGVMTYVAQPLGRTATAFPGAVREPGLVVFENAAHDWPKRISYRRTDAGVDVRVEGDAGDAVEAWTYRPAVTARDRQTEP